MNRMRGSSRRTMPEEPTWGLVIHALGAAFGVQVGEHVLNGRRPATCGRRPTACPVPWSLANNARGGAAGRSRSDPRGGAQALRVPARPLAEAPTGSGGQYRPGLCRGRRRRAAAELLAGRPLPPAVCAPQEYRPTWLLHKSDLLTGETREMFEIYRRAGWPLLSPAASRGGIWTTSALVRPGEPDHRHFWCRQSSLLNALEPGLGLRVGSGKRGNGQRPSHDARLPPGPAGRRRLGRRHSRYARPVCLGRSPRARPSRLPELEPYIGRCQHSNCVHRRAGLRDCTRGSRERDPPLAAGQLPRDLEHCTLRTDRRQPHRVPRLRSAPDDSSSMRVTSLTLVRNVRRPVKVFRSRPWQPWPRPPPCRAASLQSRAPHTATYLPLLSGSTVRPCTTGMRQMLV